MSNSKIFITLPKNISFSVFEALKVHVNYFEFTGREVVYLSRNKQLVDDRMIYFDSVFSLIKYLRMQKNGILYSITVIEVIIAYLSNIFVKKKTIIFWVQGLIDEEDFHTNKKKYRYYIYKFLFKRTLKIANKLILVTNEMHRVLINKYNLNKQKNILILKCSSRVGYNKIKKIKNSLCYIGGLSKWQNVDKMLLFFNELLKHNTDYSFFLATFNHVEAKKIIDKYIDPKNQNKINLISVKEKDEVELFLNKMEYGFLLRDNILLNHVASPIKLAEYLACGVNPIISDSLKEFKDIINKEKCGIVIENENLQQGIKKLLSTKSNPKNAIELYNKFFLNDNLIFNIKSFLNEN